MKPFFLLCLSVFLLSSCSYQLSTHSFYYHGTDALRTDQDFHYIKYGVIGTSNTTYNFRGGGDVREGLVADAKRDMQANFPLSTNQSYANLSVDIVKTEVGNMVEGQYSATSILLKCTISADVIQYGELLQNDDEPMQSSGSLNNLSIGAQSVDDIDMNSNQENMFEPGQFIKYNPPVGDTVKAEIIKRTDKSLYIRYKKPNGNMKERWISVTLSDISPWKD